MHTCTVTYPWKDHCRWRSLEPLLFAFRLGLCILRRARLLSSIGPQDVTDLRVVPALSSLRLRIPNSYPLTATRRFCAQCKHWVFCGVRGGCGAGCNETLRGIGFNGNATVRCWGQHTWPTRALARVQGLETIACVWLHTLWDAQSLRVPAAQLHMAAPG